ncbi:hypothetical protein JTL76_37570, partial [Pseudomonas aeruginosa]|nr:hypothetical protein [Pseudomonas aeruginosa]
MSTDADFVATFDATMDEREKYGGAGNGELKQATSSDPSGSGPAAPGPPDDLPQVHSQVDGPNTGPLHGSSDGPKTGHAAWAV